MHSPNTYYITSEEEWTVGGASNVILNNKVCVSDLHIQLIY